MMIRFFVIGAIMLLAAPAVAASVTCGDFRENGDGTWTSLKPEIFVGDAKLEQGARFNAKVHFKDFDLGALLDAQCRGTPPSKGLTVPD